MCDPLPTWDRHALIFSASPSMSELVSARSTNARRSLSRMPSGLSWPAEMSAAPRDARARLALGVVIVPLYRALPDAAKQGICSAATQEARAAASPDESQSRHSQPSRSHPRARIDRLCKNLGSSKLDLPPSDSVNCWKTLMK
jgi:hypothetical protein